MHDYFGLMAKSLLLKLNMLKDFNFKHNPTIGMLTEEILRDFLREHLPKLVSVNQGFIMNQEGKCSKQCDIIIWNSHSYAPFYRINDLVIVPQEAVVAVVEVKTTLNKSIFHEALDFFLDFYKDCKVRMYLFAYNSTDVHTIDGFFDSYEFTDERRAAVSKIFPSISDAPRQNFYDHDTFHVLPYAITGLNASYHLQQDYVILDGEYMSGDFKGYNAYYFENQKGTEINALQQFYLSVYSSVEQELERMYGKQEGGNERMKYFKASLSKYAPIPLFQM